MQAAVVVFEPWNKLVVKATYSSYPYEPLSSLSQEKTQLALDRLLTDWATPEEPEPWLSTKSFGRVTPALRPSPSPPAGQKRDKESNGQYTSEEDTEYSASSPPPSKGSHSRDRTSADLYKVLGSKGPDQSQETQPALDHPPSGLPSYP